MKKPAAVEGLEFEAKAQGGVIVADIDPRPPTPLGLRIEGKNVYRKNLPVTIRKAVSGMCTQTASVMGTIQPSATKTRYKNELIMREGDVSLNIPIPGTMPDGKTPCTINAIIEIKKAGQEKVRIE